MGSQGYASLKRVRVHSTRGLGKRATANQYGWSVLQYYLKYKYLPDESAFAAPFEVENNEKSQT